MMRVWPFHRRRPRMDRLKVIRLERELLPDGEGSICATHAEADRELRIAEVAEMGRGLANYY